MRLHVWLNYCSSRYGCDSPVEDGGGAGQPCAPPYRTNSEAYDRRCWVPPLLRHIETAVGPSTWTGAQLRGGVGAATPLGPPRLDTG